MQRGGGQSGSLTMIPDCHLDGSIFLRTRFDGSPPIMKGIWIEHKYVIISSIFYFVSLFSSSPPLYTRTYVVYRANKIVGVCTHAELIENVFVRALVHNAGVGCLCMFLSVGIDPYAKLSGTRGERG